MKSLLLLLCLLIAGQCAMAQSTLKLYIKDAKTKEAVIGATATIIATKAGSASDINGFLTLPVEVNSNAIVLIRAMGYKDQTDTFFIPTGLTFTQDVYLVADDEELDEVMVSSTRSSRTIKDIPTRIELLGGEEVDEKVNMKPGDIRMMLSESTGIQTLQTSAISGNSSIRIQGLDGRYTQLLKDGFPMYSGFSGGLGLLQTPPLDLKQVEIIKGASSTLYGGGAIAGLINLISKTPTEERELRFLVNGTSAGGLDVNSFYGQRFGKVGVTVYAGFNGNKPYDPSGLGISAIPKIERYSINPKFFWYPNKKTDVIVGFNAVNESRVGGDMKYLAGSGDSTHSYYEDNRSGRYNSQFEVRHRLSATKTLSFKNSVDYFNRVIKSPGYSFDGKQLCSFTEATYTASSARLEWVAGLNVFTDGFKENRTSAASLRNYDQLTLGAFVQNTYNLTEHIILESGLRVDRVNEYGVAVLPRLSALFKVNNHLTSRLGGGLGYKTPNIFTEESERLSYRNILPVSSTINKMEKSYGANWDVNYKTLLADDKVSLSFNQLFFYTRLEDPLMLKAIGGGVLRFDNIDAHIDAWGAESNMKIRYKQFRLFLGYTYINSYIHYKTGTQETPLTPAHHTNSVLTYEVEGKWKLGLEAYYYGQQQLTDGGKSHDYWLCGFMAEKLWKKYSVFINFENFTDTRQPKYSSIYSGSIRNPVFRDIYAPLDGFVVNGGVKIRL